MRTVRLPAALAALLLLAALAAGCVRVVLPRVDDGDAWWDDPGADAAAGGGSVPADGVREIRSTGSRARSTCARATGRRSSSPRRPTVRSVRTSSSASRWRTACCTSYIAGRGCTRCGRGIRRFRSRCLRPSPARWTRSRCTPSPAAAHVDGLSGGALTWDTVSGQLSQTGGRFARVEAQAVSGAVCLAPTALPEEVSCAAVSGNLVLTLPGGDAGFALELQSVSGGLDCAVPVTVQGKRYVYGDGACRIDCNMVSGGVEVRLPDA